MISNACKGVDVYIYLQVWGEEDYRSNYLNVLKLNYLNVLNYVMAHNDYYCYTNLLI